MEQINFNLASVQPAPAQAAEIQQINQSLPDFDAKLKNPTPKQDEVSFTAKQRTKEEKQAILKQARTTAAGWSIIFGGLSTLYYATRTDEKVARKYNLDPEADKNLINNIRQQQTVQTLPSLFYGAGGFLSFVYNTLKSPDTLKVD